MKLQYKFIFSIFFLSGAEILRRKANALYSSHLHTSRSLRGAGGRTSCAPSFSQFLII